MLWIDILEAELVWSPCVWGHTRSTRDAGVDVAPHTLRLATPTPAE
jgi:hypothetical protein